MTYRWQYLSSLNLHRLSLTPARPTECLWNDSTNLIAKYLPFGDPHLVQIRPPAQSHQSSITHSCMSRTTPVNKCPISQGPADMKNREIVDEVSKSTAAQVTCSSLNFITAALFDMLEANSGNHLPPPSNYVAEERVPSALPMPRLSPSPLFSQGELGWWPPHLTNITEPTPPNRTSSHIRPSNSSATPAAPDYLPPRNWFNHPPTSQSAVVGGTRVVRRATHSIDTDSSDEEFPPIDRDYGSNDSALHLLASQQRHQPPYRADVSPGLPLPERSSVERPRPGMSPSNNRHVNHARNVLQARAEAEHMFSSGDAEIPGRRSRLPRISTSDFDFNLRGSLFSMPKRIYSLIIFTHFICPLAPMQRPSEFASHSRSDLAAEPQASQGTLEMTASCIYKLTTLL